jgi:nucleotide-binding universal stress UspA family protein
MMLETIVVPLDGSALAGQAVPYAAALARAGDGKLVLLHVSSPLFLDDEPPFDPTPTTERLRAAGVKAEVHGLDIYGGGLAEAICEAAEDWRAGLIVMSTHGRGGLGRWLFGSVADRVLRTAAVPVLLIPAACERTWPGGHVSRILVPLDGSPLAEEALVPAGELAAALGAELTLLTVIEPLYDADPVGFPYHAADPEVDRTQARHYLDTVADRRLPSGVPARPQVVIDRPSSSIARIARARDADLIVMATHGHGGLARLLLGSVAVVTLQRAGLPILLVRPAAVRRAATERVAGAEAAGVAGSA